jgi:hypothetical protein
VAPSAATVFSRKDTDPPVNSLTQTSFVARATGLAVASTGYGTPSIPAPLNIGRMLKSVGVIIALLSLNLGGNIGAAVFFLLLLAMVIRSPVSAYKALAICYLGLMINQAFVPKSLVWTPSRIAIPFFALLRYSIDLSQLHLSLLTKKSYLALLLFTCTMSICSILSGWYSGIALLKLLNFWSCLTAIFAGVLVIRAKHIDITEWFVSLIVAASALGIAAILFGEQYNFMRLRVGDPEATTELFNGAFLHPNCHSLYASLFILFLASLYVLGPYRRRWLAIPAIGLWFGFIVLSQSRTAAVSATIPLIILVLYARPRKNARGLRLLVNVHPLVLVGAALGAVLIAVAYDLGSDGKLTKAIVTFFNKAGSTDTVEWDAEKILRSRKGLIEFSWRNFMEHPIHGIGFQVAKTDFFIKNATLFSAPAEKGFLPTAVLEEGGVLGASAFVVFLCTLFGGWVREGNVPATVVCFAFVISNFGEVSIFSPGGSGAFGWIMVGAASILGDHCWRRPKHVHHSVFGPGLLADDHQ